MCNLNILVKNGIMEKYNFTTLLQHMTGHSYIENSDGEGVYFSDTDKTIKQNDKIDYSKYESNVKNSNFIITHQRLSTSGFSPKFHHPFNNDEIVLVHNGVVNNFATKTKSDSFRIFKDLTNYIKNTNKKKRQNIIIDAIKKVFNDECGSWSIAIYDKKEKALYYFKNSLTNITFRLGNNFIYISTQDSLYLLPCKTKKLKIEDNKIYKINDNLDCYQISEIKTREYNNYEDYTGYYNYNNSNLNYMDVQDNKKTIDEKTKIAGYYNDTELVNNWNDDEFYKPDDIIFCDGCQKSTDFKDTKFCYEWNGRICKRCHESLNGDEYFTNNYYREEEL